MFSGIVEGAVRAKKIVKDDGTMRLYLPMPKDWSINLGDSISVDGVCSTVENKKDSEFSVYYMPETLSKTTMSGVIPSHVFNLERCLTLQSLIGGHLVSGHIDTTAQLTSIKEMQDSKVMTFKLDPKFTKYIVYKGSIAVNGVSLTVVSVNSNSFVVSLIPYTLRNTNLGSLKKGDEVNIELDLIAKYLEKLSNV